MSKKPSKLAASLDLKHFDADKDEKLSYEEQTTRNKYRKKAEECIESGKLSGADSRIVDDLFLEKIIELNLRSQKDRLKKGRKRKKVMFV